MAYLWNATVLGVIARMRAIAFIVRPSARSCSTSRCRMLNCPVPRAVPGSRIREPTSPSVASGVT